MTRPDPAGQSKSMNDKDFIEKIKTINLSTRPPWEEPLKDIPRMINNPDANLAIYEESERQKKNWTKTGKWARWEKARKERAMKNKPLWIKRGAKAEERMDAING